MDKKKLIPIAAAISVILAVILLVAGTTSERPAENPREVPTPFVVTPVAEDTPANSGQTAAPTAVPSDGSAVYITEVIRKDLPEPSLPEYLGTEHGTTDGMDDIRFLEYTAWYGLSDGGHIELWRADHGRGLRDLDKYYVFGSAYMPELPQPYCPCLVGETAPVCGLAGEPAFWSPLVLECNAGRELTLYLWEDGFVSVIGAGVTCSFPDNIRGLLRDAEYFSYTGFSSVWNTATGEYRTTVGTEPDTGDIGGRIDEFLDGVHTVVFGKNMTQPKDDEVRGCFPNAEIYVAE